MKRAPRYVADALKLLHFLEKYPNQWHSIAKDARTKRAMKIVANILRSNELDIVHYPGTTAQSQMRLRRNPISRRNKKALKIALAVAYKIWRSHKKFGFARKTHHRLPKPVRRYLKTILKANRITNPPDRTAARELELYMSSDSGLYAQRKAINANLLRKLRKGIFRKHLAARLFMYWVDNGARKYVREFGGEVRTIFPKRTRLRVARSFTREFLTEARLGNYD